jgi:hypothetical protein
LPSRPQYRPAEPQGGRRYVPGRRKLISRIVASRLAVIHAAAEAGDADAAAWLRGEGTIVIVSPFKAEFVRWEDVDDRTSPAALEWSQAVFARDGYRCVDCGAKGKLQAHHKRSWAEYPALRFDLDNGETLCVDCHAGRHPGKENLIRNSRYAKNRGLVR